MIDRRESFGILYVCTGNICRSPFAELLTKHLLAVEFGGNGASLFRVSSAGVHAVVGARMDDDSRDELMPWGLDGVVAGRFSARQLHVRHIEDADLILGASPSHRAAVVTIAPEALPVTFSILEYARLVGSLEQSAIQATHPVERAHELVGQARLRRGLTPIRPGQDRIPDPLGCPHAAHREVAGLMHDAVATIVAVISGSPQSDRRNV